MNLMNISSLSREDLERLFVETIVHLRCLSGNSNSFMSVMHDRVVDMWEPQEQRLHLAAAEHLHKLEQSYIWSEDEHVA